MAGQRRYRLAAHFDPDLLGAGAVGAAARDLEFLRNRDTLGEATCQRLRMAIPVGRRQQWLKARPQQAIGFDPEQRAAGDRRERDAADGVVTGDEVVGILGDETIQLPAGFHLARSTAVHILHARNEAAGIGDAASEGDQRQKFAVDRHGNARWQQTEHGHRMQAAERQQRKAGRNDHQTPVGGERGFQRHQDQPGDGERTGAAGKTCGDRHDRGQVAGRKQMREFEVAGTRQRRCDADLGDEADTGDHGSRARRAGPGEVGSEHECRKQTAEQMRSDQGAMPATQKRIVTDRGVYPAIDSAIEGPLDAVAQFHEYTHRTAGNSRRPRFTMCGKFAASGLMKPEIRVRNFRLFIKQIDDEFDVP